MKALLVCLFAITLRADPLTDLRAALTRLPARDALTVLDKPWAFAAKDDFLVHLPQRIRFIAHWIDIDLSDRRKISTGWSGMSCVGGT